MAPTNWAFKLNIHKEKGENLIELVFEKELFRNVKTQCYDILHLSSQTPHRRRRNTEWLTKLNYQFPHRHTCTSVPVFFFVFLPFVSDKGFKARRGTAARPLPQLDPLVFFSTKRHSRCTPGSNNLLPSNSAQPICISVRELAFNRPLDEIELLTKTLRLEML